MFDAGTITIEGLPLTVSRDEAWMELHAALQGIGVKRAKLDARELELLLEAEETRLFRRLGHPTMAAYMVAELECARHTANEKLRVAHELIDLPEIARRFRAGALSWTKVRELTRVATADTEDEWLEAIRDVDGSQVQQMVKGFAKGARPTDRRDPDLIEELIGLRVPPVIEALWRQMRVAMDGEAGRRLGDAELAEQLCKRALMPAAENGHTRPLFQIAVTTCRVCKCAEQVGPGVVNEINAAAFERALCDAVFVGDLERRAPGARAVEHSGTHAARRGDPRSVLLHVSGLHLKAVPRGASHRPARAGRNERGVEPDAALRLAPQGPARQVDPDLGSRAGRDRVRAARADDAR
jgi:Domain of unknown function (DUF222)